MITIHYKISKSKY